MLQMRHSTIYEIKLGQEQRFFWHHRCFFSLYSGQVCSAPHAVVAAALLLNKNCSGGAGVGGCSRSCSPPSMAAAGCAGILRFFEQTGRAELCMVWDGGNRGHGAPAVRAEQRLAGLAPKTFSNHSSGFLFSCSGQARIEGGLQLPTLRGSRWLSRDGRTQAMVVGFKP